MSFSPAVATKALVACGRHCCICHKFAGIKIELHHIVEQSAGGPNTFENCIPLCFDCHGDMRSYDFKHPKGRKYTTAELTEHRDRWYAKYEATGGSVASPEHTALDRAVFTALRKALPYDPVIRTLKERVAGEPVLINAMNPIHSYVEAEGDPSREFLDADLEALRAELLVLLADYVELIVTHTFAGDAPGLAMFSQVQKYDDPDRYYELVRGISKHESKVVVAYRALVSAARRKLAVDVPAEA